MIQKQVRKYKVLQTIAMIVFVVGLAMMLTVESPDGTLTLPVFVALTLGLGLVALGAFGMRVSEFYLNHYKRSFEHRRADYVDRRSQQ